MKNTSTLYIGIDPGITGACSIITITRGDESLKVFDYESGGAINELARHIINNRNNIKICIEDVHARRGWALQNSEKLILNVGRWRGVIEYLNAPYELAKPKVWQKLIFGDNKTPENMTRKSMSLDRVRVLYPEYIDQYFKLASHHNRADATLIATYCQMRNLNAECIGCSKPAYKASVYEDFAICSDCGDKILHNFKD